MPPASSTSARAGQARASAMPMPKSSPPASIPSGEKRVRIGSVCTRSSWPAAASPWVASRATASASANACNAGAIARLPAGGRSMNCTRPRSRQKLPKRAATPKPQPRARLAQIRSIALPPPQTLACMFSSDQDNGRQAAALVDSPVRPSIRKRRQGLERRRSERPSAAAGDDRFSDPRCRCRSPDTRLRHATPRQPGRRHRPASG